MPGTWRWFKRLLPRLGIGRTEPDAGQKQEENAANSPRFESIAGLGKLERHPQVSDWWQSQPVKVNLGDGKLLPFILQDDYNQLSLLPAIESAVANFLALDANHRQEMTKLVYKNYTKMIKISNVEPLPVKEKSDVWRYVYPNAVYVNVRVQQGSYNDPEIHIVVAGDCEWEPEHGLQVVLKNGNEIVGVSYEGDKW